MPPFLQRLPMLPPSVAHRKLGGAKAAWLHLSSRMGFVRELANSFPNDQQKPVKQCSREVRAAGVNSNGNKLANAHALAGTGRCCD